MHPDLQGVVIHPVEVLDLIAGRADRLTVDEGALADIAAKGGHPAQQSAQLALAEIVAAPRTVQQVGDQVILADGQEEVHGRGVHGNALQRHGKPVAFAGLADGHGVGSHGLGGGGKAAVGGVQGALCGGRVGSVVEEPDLTLAQLQQSGSYRCHTQGESAHRRHSRRKNACPAQGTAGGLVQHRGVIGDFFGLRGFQPCFLTGHGQNAVSGVAPQGGLGGRHFAQAVFQGMGMFCLTHDGSPPVVFR